MSLIQTYIKIVSELLDHHWDKKDKTRKNRKKVGALIRLKKSTSPDKEKYKWKKRIVKY